MVAPAIASLVSIFVILPEIFWEFAVKPPKIRSKKIYKCFIFLG
jgi:hypothetical protein